MIALLLCGCSTTPYSSKNSNYEKELNNGYFVEVDCFDSFDYGLHMSYKIVYAKDTNVKYLIFTSNSGTSGITPLYNADGTLQVYEN